MIAPAHRHRRPPRGATIAATLLVALSSLAACGVPLDDEPRAIDRSTTTTTTAPPTGGTTGSTMSVYFFDGDDLVDQQVPAGDTPSIDDAVNAVLGEPEPPLTTQIPTGTELLGFRLDGNTAVIDLSDDIEAFTGPAQKQAYAQLVFTTLASRQVQQVRFKVAGKAVKAPTDQGNLDVVTADDYNPPLNPR